MKEEKQSGRQIEEQRMFEGEKSWKIRNSGQKTRQWSKLFALTLSDRNSDRRGIREIRGKTEVSCSILHGLYRLLYQHEKITPNYKTGQDINGRDIQILCRCDDICCVG